MPPSTQIPLSSIILDETIYPRKGIDPKRVGIFSELGLGPDIVSIPFAENGSVAIFGKWRFIPGIHRGPGR